MIIGDENENDKKQLRQMIKNMLYKSIEDIQVG